MGRLSDGHFRAGCVFVACARVQTTGRGTPAKHKSPADAGGGATQSGSGDAKSRSSNPPDGRIRSRAVTNDAGARAGGARTGDATIDFGINDTGRSEFVALP